MVRVMLLYAHELFLEHVTGTGHPERPERLSHTLKHLQVLPLWTQLHQAEWKPLDLAALTSVHAREHGEKVSAFAEHGGGRIDQDTVV